MRAVVLFAFLAVGFTAAVAAPHVSNEVAVRKVEPENLLIDIISAIIGVDIEAVIEQGEVTIKGLERVFKNAGVELENIFRNSGQDLLAQAQAILADSAAKAEAILEPIVTIIERILSLLGITKFQDRSAALSNPIVDLIVLLINNVIKMVDKAATELQQLAIDTVVALQELAYSAGTETLSELTMVAAGTIVYAALEIQPLLDLLAPLLQPREPSEIIKELIKAILGLDVEAVVAQVEVTITGLDALFTSSANELNQILVNAGIDAQAQIKAVIDKANAEVEAILKPLVNLIKLIISLLPSQGVAAGKMDLISDIIEKLFNYIATSVERLEKLVVDTVNELVAVAAQAGANTAGQIEDLAKETTAKAQALIQPLLDLLDPIIPDAKPQITHLLKKNLH